MTLVEIELSDDEEVVRVFARRPSEKSKPLQVHGADFARRKNNSGISLWRASSRQEAKERWTTSWPKGTLLCKAGPFKKLGLRFYGNHSGDNHLSTRCDDCDLSPNQFNARPLCQRKDLSSCLFENQCAITTKYRSEPGTSRHACHVICPRYTVKLNYT